MSDAVSTDGGVAETPATSLPAEPVPEVASLAPEPIPAVEIEAAPAAPEPPVSEPIPPESEAAVSSAAATPAAPAPIPAPPPPPSPDTSIKSRLSQAFEALRYRKRARLEKILQLAAKKKSIKNDDVEKLLRVSDSTAQRYLNQLVLEGKLFRSGSAQHAVYERV